MNLVLTHNKPLRTYDSRVQAIGDSRNAELTLKHRAVVVEHRGYWVGSPTVPRLVVSRGSSSRRFLVLLHEVRITIQIGHGWLLFYLQIRTILSGAEGSRTPDLRRAKADP
jgi:hypothetical protein